MINQFNSVNQIYWTIKQAYPIEQQYPPIDHIDRTPNIVHDINVKGIVVQDNLVFYVINLFVMCFIKRIDDWIKHYSFFLKYCSYHCFELVMIYTCRLSVVIFHVRVRIKIYYRFMNRCLLWEQYFTCSRWEKKGVAVFFNSNSVIKRFRIAISCLYVYCIEFENESDVI